MYMPNFVLAKLQAWVTGIILYACNIRHETTLTACRKEVSLPSEEKASFTISRKIKEFSLHTIPCSHPVWAGAALQCLSSSAAEHPWECHCWHIQSSWLVTLGRGGLQVAYEHTLPEWRCWELGCTHTRLRQLKGSCLTAQSPMGCVASGSALGPCPTCLWATGACKHRW